MQFKCWDPNNHDNLPLAELSWPEASKLSQLRWERESMIYFPVRLFVRNDWKISRFPSKIRILRWFTVTADWTRVLLPSCGLTGETVNSLMFIYISNLTSPSPSPSSARARQTIWPDKELVAQIRPEMRWCDAMWSTWDLPTFLPPPSSQSSVRSARYKKTRI